MTSQHAVRCKKTGAVLGVKLDGGECACPSADECREVMRAETLNEFLDRVCDREECRREVEEKFEHTFRDVIETMKRARSMLLDLIEQRDKAEARFSSLLEIGPVATERERCAKLVQVYGVEQDFPFTDIIKKIRSGEHAGDGT